jgi:hypothetical protein
MPFNKQTNVNENNLLYKNIIELLNKDNSVYELVDYLKNNNIFTKETYIGEPYDGTIFKIPLHLWTFKTPILNVLKLLFLLIIVINNYGGVYYTLSQTPCSSKHIFFFYKFMFFINF